MQKLYNPNDGLTGRDGGPYLDEVQAVQAEERRAKIEGRKPGDPSGIAGIPLITAAQLRVADEVNNNPSQTFGEVGVDEDSQVDALVKSDKNLLQPFSERDLDALLKEEAPKVDENLDATVAKPKPRRAPAKKAVPAKKVAETAIDPASPTVPTKK